MTFKAEKMQPVKDGIDIIISYKDGVKYQCSNNKIVIPIDEKGILRSGGKEYFDQVNTPNNYNALKQIINNKKLWGKSFPKFKEKAVDKEMAMRSFFAHRIKKNYELNKLFK